VIDIVESKASVTVKKAQSELSRINQKKNPSNG